MSMYDIKIIPNKTAKPSNKLADAELCFTEGDLKGLKLVGIAVWSPQIMCDQVLKGLSVTFPVTLQDKDGHYLPLTKDGPMDRLEHVIIETYHKEQHAIISAIEPSGKLPPPKGR